MDPKLTILFLLIGAIIALSYVGNPGFANSTLARLSRLMPGRRKH